MVYAQPRICLGEWDTNFSEILIYKRITLFQQDDKILLVSKVGDLSRGWTEGSLFNSNYTAV